MGKAGTDKCKLNNDLTLTTCGFPIKYQKIEGPSPIINFLGIELDMHKMEARLPQDKLEHLKEELQKWNGRKSCQKRTLLSLIGRLSHVCKVVVAGRIFLQRMIDRAKAVRRLNHWVHLTADFHSDLA